MYTEVQDWTPSFFISMTTILILSFHVCLGVLTALVSSCSSLSMPTPIILVSKFLFLLHTNAITFSERLNLYACSKDVSLGVGKLFQIKSRKYKKCSSLMNWYIFSGYFPSPVDQKCTQRINTGF